MLYVQDGQLKSTTAQKSRGSAQFEEFKAATNAFIDSFKEHYGAKLGQTARNTLQEYIEMGRPITASVVTQLLDFADKFVKDNLGSTHSVTVGDRTIDLGKIGLDKMSRVGFRQTTKIAKAQAGQRSSVDTDRLDEVAFVALMERLVKAANVWTRRLARTEFAPRSKPPPTSRPPTSSSDRTPRVDGTNHQPPEAAVRTTSDEVRVTSNEVRVISDKLINMKLGTRN